MSKKVRDFAVLGLGEFGRSVAVNLMNNGSQVIAVDVDEKKVDDIADQVTCALTANCCDPKVLKDIGVGNVEVAIIGIGNSLESSILATMSAKEVGVKRVIAKASTDLEAEILRRVGADQVVFPEKAMGARIARNIIAGNFVDMIELSKDFSVAEFPLPASWEGKTLKELSLRSKGINVIGIKQGEYIETSVDPDKPLNGGFSVLAVGKNDAIESVTR